MRLVATIVVATLLVTGCDTDPGSPDDPNSAEALQLTARTNPDAAATAYTNGRWYTATDDGVVFVAGERFAENGVFVAERPADATTVDLGGAFVVPPYGEAHNHSVDGPGTEAAAAKYMAEGTFYYKNPNGIYGYTLPMLDHWAKPDTLDVSFAYGGLSIDEGHPEPLYRMLLGFGLYADFDSEDLDGNAFYDVSTLKQLDAKWETILANKPDFLKLYLLEHDAESSAGLSEEMFREIVRRAREIDMRTAVHVETVQDIALAVDAGATEAAHLPAYDLAIAKDAERAVIPDAVIQQMAAQGFIVVATVNVAQGREYSEDDLRVVTDNQAHNLRRMKEAGVSIAVGSDTYFQTTWNEILSLRSLDVFSDAELLELWVRTPALSIFPGRAVGALDPGFEESFLVLECNPTADIECAIKIRDRVKNGVWLD